jgi:hypothetical protein
MEVISTRTLENLCNHLGEVEEAEEEEEEVGVVVVVVGVGIVVGIHGSIK